MKLTRRRFLHWAGFGLVGGAAYAVGIEPVWLRVEERTLQVPGLPPAFDGYRVAQLSDLHLGGGVPHGFLRDAFASVVDWGADLAVVTGDLLDDGGPDAPLDDLSALLSGLEAQDGVVCTLGNHDTRAFHPGGELDDAAVKHIERAIEDGGAMLLRNRFRRIKRDGSVLRVAGFGDLWSGDFEPSRTQIAEPDGVTLALSHNPDTAPELVRRGAGVILCGHTHGGQVRVPFYGPPWIPLRREEYLAGHFDVSGAHLYVNCGLGYSHRIRFRARPEVTLLTLRAATRRS